MMINTSIIIPTLHRKDSVCRLLQSLEKEVDASVEVIVVEQGGRNEKEILKMFRGTRIHPLYIYVPIPSMTRARNVGAKKARGKYLLFLDDDDVAKPGLIQHHIQNFRDPQVAATCGRCITQGHDAEENWTHIGRVSWLGTVSEGYSSAIKQKIDSVIGCNMCWRRDIYSRLAGVDEQFTGNALREETDLSLRAKKLGYSIVFEPLAVIEHTQVQTGGARKSEGRITWYYDFFSNETYFFLKNRPAILLPLYIMVKTEWALRCMFGFGREVSVRSLTTPLLGIMDGIKKYNRYMTNGKL